MEDEMDFYIRHAALDAAVEYSKILSEAAPNFSAVKTFAKATPRFPSEVVAVAVIFESYLRGE